MATLNSQTLSLLQSSFPSAASTLTPATSPLEATSTIFPQFTYSDADGKDIADWVASVPKLVPGDESLTLLNSHLATRTTILGSRPSVADVAVYAQLAPYVKNWSKEERSGEKGYHHVTRLVDLVENAALFGPLQLAAQERANVDANDVAFVIRPLDAKAEKERKKKEKEAAAAAAKGASVAKNETPAQAATAGEAAPAEKQGKKEKLKEKVEHAKDAVVGAIPGVHHNTEKKQKKEKKDKPAKAKPAPVPEKPLSPSLIDLRVGHILKAIAHPNADSLYVSTIACGDAPGTENTSEYEGQVVRTVCSGLNGLIPLADMQNRKIVAVCNLKPVTMRGIKSCAMVLAASPREDPAAEPSPHKGPVELVSPPADAKAGERIYFEGWHEGEPEPVLNPKKKVWETIQPGFTTTEDLGVGFDVGAVEALKESGKTGVGKLRTKEGLCTVPSLKGAVVR